MNNENPISVVKGLSKPELQDTAAALVMRVSQTETALDQERAKAAETDNWLKQNVPKLMGRSGRFLLTAASGVAVGAVHGTVKDPRYAMAISAGASVGAAALSLGFKNVEVQEALLCTSGAIAASTLAIEATKATKQMWDEREAAKASAKANAKAA